MCNYAIFNKELIKHVKLKIKSKLFTHLKIFCSVSFLNESFCIHIVYAECISFLHRAKILKTKLISWHFTKEQAAWQLLLFFN